MMEDDQQFCLRWNNHQSTLISVFDTLLENEKLVDCTLAAEGRIMKAHKVVLSACSPYFATLLQEQYDKHPIFILKDVKYQELRAMMDYMYRGEVNISQDQLAALLKAAESLQIKGLSDNRTGAPPRAEHQQQQQHHRGLNVPGGSKLSGGYTLEAQSKRARVGAGQLDTQDMSGSREGSSSPSRRRRKVRRRSIENVMAEPHDNSNSSQQQQSSLLQSNAGLAGVSAITAAATALASQLPSVVGSVATPGSTIATTQAIASAQQQQQQQQQPPQQQQQHQQQQQGQLMPTTTGVTKKTENVKGTTSDAMNTENVLCTVSGSAAVAVDADVMEQQQQHQQHHAKTDKQNHKQKQTSGGVAKDASEMVIEPKSEYDEEGNDETCEDLTLDDEDMGMDDLDQNAGTSQGGEGSSQGYAAWQHDRSQDEILLTQEAQQRDPQDLSITRIAGLTWNEWNARLAMPLVTQLREGVHPLIFPTDLSINQAIEKQNAGSSNTAIPMTTSNTSGAETADTDDPKSPPLPVTPPNESSNDAVPSGTSGSIPMSSTPLNCSNTNVGISSAEKRSGGKLKRLTEEEARTLMLKAAAEKNAAAFNNSGNLSDSSYSADVKSNAGASGGGGGGGGDSASDFHSALSSGGAFADVSGAAGLCNMNLLSISAMNSLIGGVAVTTGGGGGGSGSAGNNGGIGLGGSSAGLSLSASGGGSGGGGGGAGHPCPECGRVYKLKSSLRNHQKWECGKEPQFQCPFCVYRAKQKMHIGRHMERMHKEKFIKLEDLKSYTSGGENDENGGATAAAAAAAVAAATAGALASADLRPNFYKSE